MLHLSQTRLSFVERGTASLTAEQFLEFLKIFNVPVTDFLEVPPDDRLQEIQNVLVRHGARHLRVSDRILASTDLAHVHAVIVEALVSGSPRLLTALAPVLLQNANVLNLVKLAADAHAVGVRRRLYWVIENTIEAIERLTASPTSRLSRGHRVASRRLQTAMRFAEGYEQVEPSFDLLDPSIASKRSADDVRHESSDISKRWRIISSLQPDDFAAALRDAHAGN